MATVVFDLETTGLHPTRGSEILEIAAAVLLPDGSISDAPTGRFHERCCPVAGEIPPKITELTGLKWTDVADAAPPCEVVPRFCAWLRAVDAVTLVGHNAIGFDMRFLQEATVKEVAASTLAEEGAGQERAKGIVAVFDTHLYARHEDGAGPYVKGYRQTDLYSAAFSESQPDQHTAMGDVAGLARLIAHRNGWLDAIHKLDEGAAWVRQLPVPSP